jgi:hypothetical protein
MEPTLHCARPGNGCEARFDRVLANRFIYHSQAASGRHHRLQDAATREQRCGAGGTFVQRLIALPGETWREKSRLIYIDGKAQ